MCHWKPSTRGTFSLLRRERDNEFLNPCIQKLNSPWSTAGARFLVGWQSVPWQPRFCTSDGQCLPPFCGFCRTVRLRDVIPGPQGVSHSFHGPHSLTAQSITAEWKWNRQITPDIRRRVWNLRWSGRGLQSLRGYDVLFWGWGFVIYGWTKSVIVKCTLYRIRQSNHCEICKHFGFLIYWFKFSKHPTFFLS